MCAKRTLNYLCCVACLVTSYYKLKYSAGPICCRREGDKVLMDIT